ncbi:hypothetical protein IE53DRAFT_390266 [Violaceomyces palustris]|uniref:Uncharacterized protein n=1 Tax=Violaceomyces palustris TaxID=1673888 RepID=A0ACD0NP76_9BASI|nr:hypothetical protein IE53DRAFT_390266 [Violaceomyces palustris]
MNSVQRLFFQAKLDQLKPPTFPSPFEWSLPSTFSTTLRNLSFQGPSLIPDSLLSQPLQLSNNILSLTSRPPPAVLLSPLLPLLLLLFLMLSNSSTRHSLVGVFSELCVPILHPPFLKLPLFLISPHSEQPLPRSNALLSNLHYSLRLLLLKLGGHLSACKPEEEIDWLLDPPKLGDYIRSWGTILVWDQHCVHPSWLQKCRGFVDPLADAALASLKTVHPVVARSGKGKTDRKDALGLIYSLGAQGDGLDSADEGVRLFIQATNRRPPRGAGALSEDWYNERDSRRGKKPRAASGPWISKHEVAGSGEDFFQVWTPRSESSSSASDSDEELEEELRAEAEVLQRGQDVFYKYAGPMLLSLLHFSLAGGFSSPRITSVLRQTSYLVPSQNNGSERKKPQSPDSVPIDPALEPKLKDLPSVSQATADRTWRRLLETTQFVLDVMEEVGSLNPPCLNRSPTDGGPARPEEGGKGWQSALRVRLLHASVRGKIWDRIRSEVAVGSERGTEVYDEERNGNPINQEDLLATLCSFSVAPLACLQTMGIQPTLQERQDFIALWRHVGFYMGVEPGLLKQCFSDPKTCDRTLTCCVLHLFGRKEIDRDKSSGNIGPTIPVLISCSNRKPFRTSLSQHFSISRRLLGDHLSDSLGIPVTSALTTLVTDLTFLGMKIPILFGRLYPLRRRWETDRLRLARPLLRRLIAWNLGGNKDGSGRITNFVVYPFAGGAEDGEDVKFDSDEGKRLVRHWNSLMREMMVVSASSALFVGGAVVLGSWKLLSRS